jgi:hypothetical protein
MIFWLMLKIEISYTVIILKDLHFHMVKQLSFHNSSFTLRYFLMQMARPQCDTPLVGDGLAIQN